MARADKTEEKTNREVALFATVVPYSQLWLYGDF